MKTSTGPKKGSWGWILPFKRVRFWNESKDKGQPPAVFFKKDDSSIFEGHDVYFGGSFGHGSGGLVIFPLGKQFFFT